MQVVSFINMKGGVGKTTLAVNVAYGLAQFHKKNVLIVDADPQFNATQYLVEDDVYLDHLKDSKKGTLHDIFVPRKPGAMSTVFGSAKSTSKAKMPLSACTLKIFDGGAGRGKLELIPSTLALIDIQTSKRQTEKKLSNFLQEKAAGFDYVIIDCPPTISIFTEAAILASDKYLVPVKPDPLSMVGLPLLERWLDDYCEDAGVKLKNVGLVFTLVRGPLPKRMSELMEELKDERGDDVFGAHLSQANDVAKSVEAHQPVFHYKRNCKTAAQLIEITDEFVQRTSGD